MPAVTRLVLFQWPIYPKHIVSFKQMSISNSVKIFSILSILLLIYGCSDNDDDRTENPSNENRAPTVEAVQVITGSLPLEENLTGVVRAQNQADIYPEITAPITEVAVNNGDYVDQGQVLVRLRDTEAQERLRQAESGYQIARAQVRQAEADLNQKKAMLARTEQLRSRDLETEAELENIKAEVESAEATLDLNIAQKNQARSVIEERKNELENTVIRAPINGLVGLRNADTGQQANPSTRLFQIGDPGLLKLEMVLTEAMTSYILPGQQAVISSPGSENAIESTITRISPFLNPITHTTTAEIEFSNPDNLIRPGMFVTVSIKYGESEQAILVPNNAMFYHPNYGNQGVFIAERIGLELSFEGEEPPEELIGPAPVRFVPVNVIANGRLVSGIEGIPSDSWVVTLGQNLLLRGAEQANVRPVSWDHIINLQEIQSRDLFEIIQEKMAKRSQESRAGV